MATYKIAIDTLGSDKGPETIVQGALMALAENPELSVALFGDVFSTCPLKTARH